MRPGGRPFGAAALALALLAAFASAATAQTGYDRRGGDYKQFTINNGDPAACAAACERDVRCQAWSFSYPGTAAPTAACWLKSKIPPRIADKCCVSGVRGAGVIEPAKGAAEYSTDRPGGDYRNFETAPDPEGTACRTACSADKSCRAWTYTRPGYAGPAARCALKTRITRPRPKPCCISGVVR